MSCKHTSWIRISRTSRGVKAQMTDRFSQLLDNGNEDLVPSIVLLLGNKGKNAALDELDVGARKENALGDISLHILPTKSRTIHTLLAEANVFNDRLPDPWECKNCHETFEEELQSQTTSEAIRTVYKKAVMPFVDVLCLIVEDFGDIQAVANIVISWLDGPQSISPVLPEMILVTTSDSAADVLYHFYNCFSEEGRARLDSGFSKIRWLSLSKSWNLRRQHGFQNWALLKRELLLGQRRVIRAKQAAGFLFSSCHMNSFVLQSLHNVRSVGPFDFVELSRTYDPLPVEMEECLSRFVGGIPDLATLKSFAVPVIASAFILNQYPPNGHDFPSKLVFKKLYKQICISASRRLALQDPLKAFMLPSAFASLIENEMSRQYEECLVEKHTARNHHSKQLAEHTRHWDYLRPDDICLTCLSTTRPEYILPCGRKHSICLSCLKIFGILSHFTAKLNSCLLCKEDIDFQVRLNPVNAAIRVCTIDGGGSRARGPLGFLKEIEAAVDLPYPVLENFDVIYGTSSGAISICCLCMNGWSVDDCISLSDELAKYIFKPRDLTFLPLSWVPIIQEVWQLIATLFLDSKYPSKQLDHILQVMFGPDKKIGEYSAATRNGQYLGFTATTTEEVKTYIITNYNGSGQRKRQPDYEVMQAADGLGTTPLWIFLRGATAAPVYFKPQLTRGVGYLQDGGITHNNPVSIAVREAEALFPNSEIGTVLSLSTGTDSVKQERKQSGPTYRRFYKRILFAVVAIMRMQSRQAGHNISNYHHNEMRRYFRFDIDYRGETPSLDSVTNSDYIGRRASETIRADPELRRLAKCIRAEQFVFELCQNPRYVNGQYECVGRIRCRLDLDSDGFRALMRSLAHEEATFRIDETILSPVFDPLEPFNQPMTISMPDMKRSFEIMLSEDIYSSHISGSPFTLEKIVQTQKLRAVFGTREHTPRKQQNGQKRRRSEASGRKSKQLRVS